MSRGLISETKAKKIRKIDKAVKVAKVVVKKVVSILKIALIIALVYFLNVIAGKVARFVMELDFQTMKLTIFSIITIYILFNYLKVCEEVKGVD